LKKLLDPIRSRVLSVVVSALLIALIAGCKQPVLEYPPAYREYTYVTNGKSNDVTVIDNLSFKTVKTIAVGKSPTGIAASPTRNEIYVVNTESNSLSVIDAERNFVVATIGLGRTPYFLDVSNDGQRAYVANSASNNVSVIDLAGRKAIGTIGVGIAPGMARVTADGKTVVVSNRGQDSVSLLDAEKLTLRGSIFICAQPTDIAILPDSSKAFVVCPAAATSTNQKAKKSAQQTRTGEGPGQVAVIDLKTEKLLALLDVGKMPVHLALKPDAGEIFVSNFGSDSVSTIETGNNEVGNTQPMGGSPVRGLVSADNALLYESNFGSDSVSVYSIQNGKFLKAIPVGSKPDALALQPARNGKQYWLLAANSHSNDAAVIFINTDKPSWSLFTMIPVGVEPRQMVIKAFTATQNR
jgi:YVTN family beta-propeller protein